MQLEISNVCIGDIVTRTGTDRQKVTSFDLEWDTVTVECVESGGCFQIGDIETLSADRFSVVCNEHLIVTKMLADDEVIRVCANCGEEF